jgi:hypothetical protein
LAGRRGRRRREEGLAFIESGERRVCAILSATVYIIA